MIKVIEQKLSRDVTINIGKVRPFKNRCKVTGETENCNVNISYVPDQKLLEMDSLRDYLSQGFNEYIEDLAIKIYNDITLACEPKSLEVKLFMDDESLTPWNVVVR